MLSFRKMLTGWLLRFAVKVSPKGTEFIINVKFDNKTIPHTFDILEIFKPESLNK